MRFAESLQPARFRWLAIILVLCLAALPALQRGPVVAAPAQQADDVCNWNTFAGQSTQGHYYAAAAFDSSRQLAYFFGGVSQIGQVVNTLRVIDVSNPDPLLSRFVSPSVSGSRTDVYGAAGAYRPAGNRSAAYFIGGADETGEAQINIQAYNVEDGTWRKVTPLSSKKRMFHAAVYAANRDVIVVAGGTRACPLDEETRDNRDCSADNLGTQFLTFDDSDGSLSWVDGPSGGPQNLQGHSLIYDQREQRVIAFGGTRDNRLAENRVWVLDLRDPDLSKATWSLLATQGLAPKGRFHHGAALDVAGNRMIIHGGATRLGQTTGEDINSETWELDLAVDPPMWNNLGQQAAFRDLVGSNMLYATAWQRVIMHGGRARFRSRSNAQTSFRDAHRLDCAAAPTPTPAPTRATPDPGNPKVCDYLAIRVPPAVINNALANATGIQGFGVPANPGLPPGPTNPLRTYLGLQNPGVPFHPLFNNVLYKAGCP